MCKTLYGSMWYNGKLFKLLEGKTIEKIEEGVKKEEEMYPNFPYVKIYFTDGEILEFIASSSWDDDEFISEELLIFCSENP